MLDLDAIQGIKDRYLALSRSIDERTRRHWAAQEALAFGWGGLAAVSRAIGISPGTIRKGISELRRNQSLPNSDESPRVRKTGAGRKPLTTVDPELMLAFEGLINRFAEEPPRSALTWICKTTSELANELSRYGHRISPRTVGRLLNAAGFVLHPVRNQKHGNRERNYARQFEQINQTIAEFQTAGRPVISVKFAKEPQSSGETVDCDPAQQPIVAKDCDLDYAVAESVRCWWKTTGESQYSNAQELLVIIDCSIGGFGRAQGRHGILTELRTEQGLSVRIVEMPHGIYRFNTIKSPVAYWYRQTNAGGSPMKYKVIILFLTVPSEFV